MSTRKIRRNAARAGLVLAAAGGSVAFVASPALAQTITQPSSGYTVSECVAPATNCDDAVGANDIGAPLAFAIQSNGWTPGTTVFAEICDGKSPTSAGYNPTYDCDPYTSPPPVLVQANGQVNYGVGNQNDEIGDFRGEGPADYFNCLAPGDSGSTTQDGETIDTSKPSYTNCQLRLATSLTAATADQQYVSFTIPNSPTGSTPPPSTPEAPLAILLPVGAAALLGGGFLLTRRRRSRNVAA